jgi:hypothetical protein
MNNEYFYNESLKKYIKIFGALFSNYKIYHDNKEIRVQIVYGNKSKIYVDKTQNAFHEIPTQRPGEILLPLMSYQLSSIVFDLERKVPNNKLYNNSNENTIDYVYMPKPFNINFELFLWTKYENDMYQLLEQILYNHCTKIIISTNLFPTMSFKWDLPIILNNNLNDNHIMEYGQDNTLKEMKWKLDFTVKGYLFSNTFNENLIKIVTANYKGYDDSGEIDPDKIYQEEIYEVNPFESEEDDDWNIKLTKTIGDKTYITFIPKEES